MGAGYGPSDRFEDLELYDLPQWAIDPTGIEIEEVLAWVNGTYSTGRRGTVILLTKKEVIWVEKGLFTKDQHRVPRASVSSVSYRQGLFTATLSISLSSGDRPAEKVDFGRSERVRATLLVNNVMAQTQQQ